MTIGSFIGAIAPARMAWKKAKALAFLGDNSASGVGRPSGDFGQL